MNFQQVQAVLNDLPATFKRPSVPFVQWTDADTAGAYRGAGAADGIAAQVQTFDQAQYGWLDVWGLLFNVPRLGDEADSRYKATIPYVVTAGAGTPVGIAKWINAVWGVSVTVQEQLPAVGYSINFPAGLSTSQIAQIVASLGRIRPAGVPFTIGQIASNGLYLTTINFAGGAPDVTGAFLAGATAGGVLPLGPGTNNAAPIVPTVFLTDPGLNPGS